MCMGLHFIGNCKHIGYPLSVEVGVHCVPISLIGTANHLKTSSEIAYFLSTHLAGDQHDDCQKALLPTLYF